MRVLIVAFTFSLISAYLSYRIDQLEDRANQHEAWLRVQKFRADQHEQILIFILQKLGVK